jgi:hypothetical protein
LLEFEGERNQNNHPKCFCYAIIEMANVDIFEFVFIKDVCIRDVCGDYVVVKAVFKF